MNKVAQIWYLLHICYDFTVVVNPFCRAVVVPFSSGTRAAYLPFFFATSQG